jgi:hypothetical protein
MPTTISRPRTVAASREISWFRSRHGNASHGGGVASFGNDRVLFDGDNGAHFAFARFLFSPFFTKKRASARALARRQGKWIFFVTH